MPEPAPTPARVVMEVAHRSDPGRDPDKQTNEDSCAYAELGVGHLLVVCDGMGGHMSGKEASTRAVHTILHDLSQAQPGVVTPCLALRASIEHAGRVVYDLGGPGQNMLRPGSTCVSVLLHVDGADTAHVGDSRAYLMRAGQIHAITRDHSMVRQMIDAGVLSPEEAMRHPDANKITRALGMSPVVEVEVRPSPMPIERNDVFLLASDGLTDLVMPDEMLAVVMQAMPSGGLELACEQLVALANQRGGHDNITVVLGRVVDAPEMRAASATMPGAPPMTMPDMPVLGEGGTVIPHDAGLHRTVVDDGSPVMGVGAPVAPGGPVPAPTGASRTEDEDADEDPGRRRVVWIAVGAALVLMGMILVIVSMWWALSAGSSSIDEVNGEQRVASRPESPAARPGGRFALAVTHPPASNRPARTSTGCYPTPRVHS